MELPIEERVENLERVVQALARALSQGSAAAIGPNISAAAEALIDAGHGDAALLLRKGMLEFPR